MKPELLTRPDPNYIRNGLGQVNNSGFIRASALEQQIGPNGSKSVPTAANRGSRSRQQIAVGGSRSRQQIAGLEQQIMVVGSWLLGVTVSVSHEALGCWLKRVHGCRLCGCVHE
ncbi:hypothetical protein WN944_019989 [Citrus x changshan-huyou]|uniref:Uncharacterized protein n=1 Tax=Citrus x changshan-huyou TaxID=2935761 RepID=A0AAP0QGX3_9ROSI